jgi:hypothetical protein
MEATAHMESTNVHVDRVRPSRAVASSGHLVTE